MRVKEIPNEEILRQREFINIIAERNHGKSLTAFVDTYGCQQNEADSETIRGMLIEMGYSMAEDESNADLIVVNSCAVREHAEQRVLGNVGQLIHVKRRTNCIIAVCGCMVQQPAMAEKIKKSYPLVNLVFGVHALYRFPELLNRVMTTGKRVFDIEQKDGEIAEGLPVLRKDKIKAWTSVTYGCNNFCTYCIVPYVRGRERSRDPEKIVREVRELIENGCRDITLLGQNVNSYGNDLDCDIDFAALLERINAIPGNFRIRFMTSHPKDATHRLFDVMAKCEKVAKHIHLPFQSGSDRILKLMNRRYDGAKYRELVAYARSKMPDISITSDVIVGFPGESREQFEETLTLIEEVKYNSLFTFIFSAREGTPAASMEDPISREEKGKWFTELLKVQEKIGEEKIKECVGKVCRVLCDEEIEDGIYSGRTDAMTVVHFEGKPDLIGKLINVRIDSYTNVLKGTVIKER